ASAEHYRSLPGIVPAFERRNGAGGMSDHAYINLQVLDAILTGQIETRLRGRELTAVQLDAEYERLADGAVDQPRANVMLRAIEAQRHDLLSVVKVFDPLREVEQETALRRLRERIAASRESRVPDVIKQAITAIAEGKRQLEKVRTARKLQVVSRR